MFNQNSIAPTIFNQKLLAPSGSVQHTFIVGFDSSGDYQSHLLFKNNTTNPFYSEFNISTSKRIKNHLYVSGYQNNELKFGALTILHSGENDGLIIKLDTTLNLVQYYKVATVYSDFCTDIDFSKDSSYIIAYQSKGNPSVSVGLSDANASNLTGINLRDLDDAGYLNIFPASLNPEDYIYSAKNGSWHDPATWSSGKVPTQTDRVIIRHKVLVYQNATCFTLFANPNSDIQIDPNIELKITGLPSPSQ